MESRPKIRRKPPPLIDASDVDLDVDLRYPTPDPSDPFAPLWVLRSRHSNNSLKDIRAPPSVVFPIINDHAESTTSESSSSTDHHSKWHKRLLSRVAIPPSSSTSSSFVHVSSTEEESVLPTPAQLARAASLPVIAASGLRVPFASLFASRPTVVVFIRHFWCPHCQDYVSTIAQTAPHIPEKNLVIISNGAHAFIPKYRALFGLEFDIYTDPTLAVYTALGMGQTSSASAQAGDYVRHGKMSGIAMVVLRALKAGLPVWERGGDVHQLGGEFVLGPGLTCTYAHRMQSPKGHAPIRDVLSAAGIDIDIDVSPSPTTTTTTPKILATLRTKSWTPKKRSSSFNLTPTPTPPTVSARFRFKRKNTSTGSGTYPIPRTESPVPISEFGMWRRTGRVSLDSSRVLSEGARAHPHSVVYTHTHAYTAPAYPYPYQHRQYASTATLPVFSSSSPLPTEGRGHDADAEEDEWMHTRMKSLEAMRERKRERRAGFVGYYVPSAVPGGDGEGKKTKPKTKKGVGVGMGSVGARPRSLTVGCAPVKEAEEEAEE